MDMSLYITKRDYTSLPYSLVYKITEFGEGKYDILSIFFISTSYKVDLTPFIALD